MKNLLSTKLIALFVCAGLLWGFQSSFGSSNASYKMEKTMQSESDDSSSEENEGKSLAFGHFSDAPALSRYETKITGYLHDLPAADFLLGVITPPPTAIL